MPNLPEPALTLRFLEPAQVRVSRKAAGPVVISIDGEETAEVHFLRVRPLTEPESYLSVRDRQDKEIGLLRNWPRLDKSSRAVVEEDLTRRYLYPVLRRIISLQDISGVVICRFDTDRGEREVMLRDFRDNIIYLGENRLLLTDAEGNRYDIRDIAALDKKSQIYLAQMM